jgi:hypothetical protein
MTALGQPLELLWMDETRRTELESKPEWRELLPAAEAIGDEPSAPSEPAPSPPALAARKLFSNVLRRATTTALPQLESLMRRTLMSSDALEPPMVVADARLALCFDPQQRITQLVEAARPFGRLQPKVREVIDRADAACPEAHAAATPLQHAVIAELRAAWRQSNPRLSQDYLDVAAEQALLRGRHYERRELLDGTWLRVILRASSHEVVTYLPKQVTRRLPLFTELPVRLLAEVLPRQDATETGQVCLRAVALARVVELS